MKTRTIEIDGVGNILIERSKRAKHLNISVRPFKGARVAVPYGVTFRKAEKIVHQKKDWIKKHLAKMKSIEKEHNSALENSIEIDIKKAKDRLISKLDELAAKYNFKYNRVFIRKQKTRWGSCSQKNNINLNAKLIRLPEELIDYVILHELVHTKIKNHSKQFWAELDKYVGSAKALDKRLKEYGIGLL